MQFGIQFGSRASPLHHTQQWELFAVQLGFQQLWGGGCWRADACSGNFYARRLNWPWYERYLLGGGQICRKGSFTKSISHSVEFVFGVKGWKQSESHHGKGSLLSVESPRGEQIFADLGHCRKLNWKWRSFLSFASYHAQQDATVAKYWFEWDIFGKF